MNKLFLYTYRGPDGAMLKGSIEAAASADATRKIRAMGRTPLSLQHASRKDPKKVALFGVLAVVVVLSVTALVLTRNRNDEKPVIETLPRVEEKPVERVIESAYPEPEPIPEIPVKQDQPETAPTEAHEDTPEPPISIDPPPKPPVRRLKPRSAKISDPPAAPESTVDPMIPDENGNVLGGLPSSMFVNATKEPGVDYGYPDPDRLATDPDYRPIPSGMRGVRRMLMKAETLPGMQEYVKALREREALLAERITENQVYRAAKADYESGQITREELDQRLHDAGLLKVLRGEIPMVDVQLTAEEEEELIQLGIIRQAEPEPAQ